MKKLVELAGDGITIASGIIFSIIFINIILHGAFIGYEDNNFILWSELILSIVILVIGIERLIDDVRGHR